MRKTSNENSLVTRESHPVGGFFGSSRFMDLINEMNSLATELWGDFKDPMFSSYQSSSKFPKVNVSENDTSYTVDIAVAGFTKDDVNLELKDNCLLIKADKKEEDVSDDTKALLREVSYRSFQRAIQFPSEVDPTNVTCNYENGMVKCVLNKKLAGDPEDTVRINIQ
jgi:HSP20 family protein